jgi:hypothetical protein
MRYLLLLFALLLAEVVAYSQTTKVEYVYDTAGNRISRQIVSINKSAFLSDTIAIAEEKISDKIFKLYPNPTYGILTISINHLEADEQFKIEVTDMRGHTLIKEVQKSSSFKIDLSAYPKGFYILSATIGDTRKEWKIVKE